MRNLQTTLIFLQIISLSLCGWLPVKREVEIEWDSESKPLEIKTNSVLGSGDKVFVFFYSAEGPLSGGVVLYFSSTPQYWIPYCSSTSTNFPVKPPSTINKVWSITLTRTAGVRLVIHCNEVEVLNILISQATCSSSGWSTYWTGYVAKIQFHSSDTASDYYIPQPEPCGEGTYRNDAMTSCETCDAGSTPNSDKTACEPCPAGSYKNIEMNTCEECPDNTISSEGAALCTACELGQERNSARTTCEPCGEKTYRNDDMTSCETCDAGLTPNSDKTACEPCPAGSYKNIEMNTCKECPDNTISSEGAALCTTCELGQERNSARTTCEPCGEGTYRNDAMTSCETCDAGWKPNTYKTACVSCTGLKAEWRTAIRTTTQFPVVPGTVVEVNCVESRALNKGSSEVTCTSGTEFIFDFNEPECINTGIVEADMLNDHSITTKG
ncbi:endosome/lysosome-associated apoptosis and autophagy regulator 1-like [Bolinopsis microptera]|uniref:endosome/lysosome-associated apoptosis and autophagy regulator 1-like n=1 Tax=Bolinopsis microptera TaxID=2820187 RepID=UPI003078F45C